MIKNLGIPVWLLTNILELVEASRPIFCMGIRDECIFRSRRLEVFSKKSVLRNFVKFTGKHLCQSLFLIKLQA